MRGQPAHRLDVDLLRSHSQSGQGAFPLPSYARPRLVTVRGKKGSPRHGRSGCLTRCRKIRSVIFLSGIRNPVHKTCLAVMYACGLRISEATTLEVSAIDRANQVLRIIGKGNKERLVPLPQPVLDDLSCLWRAHRNRRWLFPNRHGDAPLNKRMLSDTFASAAVAAGIQRRVTPHSLRHSYA